MVCFIGRLVRYSTKLFPGHGYAETTTPTDYVRGMTYEGNLCLMTFFVKPKFRQYSMYVKIWVNYSHPTSTSELKVNSFENILVRKLHVTTVTYIRRVKRFR